MLRRSANTTRVVRRFYATAGPSQAQTPFVYTPLDSTRSLLAVQGRDSTKFLQGLVSNDVRKLKQSSQAEEGSSVIYAGLLQADGRYMSDLFLHAHPSPVDPLVPSYLIDHPQAHSTLLRSYLKRHVLRSKLKIAKELERDLQVVQVWKNPLFEKGREREREREAEEWLSQPGRGFARDPRVAGMGWRFIAEKGTELPTEYFTVTTPAHYHLHRLTYSVPENPEDFPNLPLEANLELLNAVDYKKGCYVGQELTARTHFKGVVRKRGVGIRLFREGEDVPESFLPTIAGESGSRPNLSQLIPSPNLYPTPPPGSTLIPLPPSSPSSADSKSKRAPRTPRPAGKLGSSLPLISPQTGSTLTVGFGSVKIDNLDQVFMVSPPPPPLPPSSPTAPSPLTSSVPSPSPGVDIGQGGETNALSGELKEGEEGGGEDGKWLAKGFMSEWLEFRLEEEEISKGL